MTITELIELLEDHIKEFGDLEITGFRGTAILNGKLEIESDSTSYKQLTNKNFKSVLLSCNDEILKLLNDDN